MQKARTPISLALVLLTLPGCSRQEQPNLPSLESNESPLITEYAVHVRELGQPEKTFLAACTGNESMLDAMEALHEKAGYKYDRFVGMEACIVRRGERGEPLFLPVDWSGITQLGKMDTNFLLCGGDRLILQIRPETEK